MTNPSARTALTPEEAQAVIEYLNEVITLVDADGTVLYQSPASEHIKGYSPEALIGENILEYIHPDDRDRVAEEMQQAVEDTGRYSESLEFRFRTPDEDWIWLACTATNPPADSPLDAYLVTSREITARKQQEGRLRQQRTRLDQFASVLSHDLRNPLNVAQGYLEQAQAQSELAALDTIEDALDRMDALITDTLTLAREGQAIGDRRRLSVESLVTDWWAGVDTGDATLDLRIDEDVMLSGDPERLQTVGENLIRNAIDHGGPEVTVRIGILDTGGETGLYIEDDGPGIPPEKRAEVFEPGYTTASEGTGFGLPIVEEIVTAHGWTIRVTEGELGGARFEITGIELQSPDQS